MSKVEIVNAKLTQAIEASIKIENALNRSFIRSNKLIAYTNSSKWKGKSKDAFSAYLDLVNQYHKDLVHVLKEHTNALKKLDANINSFDENPEVRKVKNL